MGWRGRSSAVLVVLVLAALALLPAAAGAAPVPLAQIGGQGDAAGQLNAPGGLAVGPTGGLAVADTSNNRVAVFTGGGQFIAALGHDVIPGNAVTGLELCTTQTGCKAGTAGGAAGQLDQPYRVALGPDANIYVADSNNDRISVFNLAGGFVRAFGHDVIPGNLSMGLETCTTATGCQAGTAGGDAGELNDPRGLKVTSGGSVYVADFLNHRVSVFTTVGGFVRAFGQDVVPLNLDMGLESCTLLCQPGTAGGAAGQLSGPSGLALDPSGNVYVTEVTGSERVSVFTGTGAFVRAFGDDVIPGGATVFETCTTTCKVGDPDDGPGELNDPEGIAVDGAGNVVVADSSNQRISAFSGGGTGFTRAFAHDVVPGGGTGFEVCTTATGCKLGTVGAAAGQFNAPADVALDCRGAVWAADSGNGRLQRLGEPGTPLCGAAAAGNPAASANVIIGTPGDDRLTGTSGADLIICGAGNDVVNAGGGNDIIDCGDGNDRVNAGAGNDVVLGGRGNDRLVGTSGNDRLLGGAGNDSVGGGAGRDTVNGESGRDRLSGNAGRDRLGGGSGNDRLLGGSSADRLTGNAGNDRLAGGSGGDRLNGSAGSDRLAGGTGADRLAGSAGNDRLSGNAGNDRLNGNSGADRLRGNAGNDRLNGGSGADRLVGGPGLDVLTGGPGTDIEQQ